MNTPRPTKPATKPASPHLQRLIRATLAIYPTAVRQRYGPEITELLTNSPTPLRDLADTAWCAVTDRGGSLTMASIRRPLAASAVLCLAPILVILTFGIGIALVTFLVEATGLVLTGTANALLNGAVVPGVGILVGLAAGILLGRRITFPNPAAILVGVLLPAVLTLTLGAGLGVMGSRDVPGFGIPIWAVTMTPLTVALWIRSRTTAPSPWWHLATGAAGLLLVDFAVTAAVWGSFTATDAPRSYAATWFPAALTWDEAGLRPGPAGNVFESMAGLSDATELLPYVLLALTSLGLSMAGVAAARASEERGL